MSRFVCPQWMALRVGTLTASSNNPQLPALRSEFFSSSTGQNAIALRWLCKDIMGFPREPFQVYRRLRGGSPESTGWIDLTTDTITLSGPAQTISVLPGGDAAYIVDVEVGVASGNSVTVQALDVGWQPIPDQVMTVQGPCTIEFRCPGICAVTVSGTGEIDDISAVGEVFYANLPGWTQIQTVGLPLLNGEIGSSYTTSPQGFWADSATPPALDGVTAAVDRMLLTTQLSGSPPPTGVADFTLPAWPQPDPTGFVTNMRGATNIVPMIERCLEKSIDTDPVNNQANYSETMTVDGLSQIGVDVPGTSPSQVTLPICAMAMLAVGTDPFAAVSLGYGTLDIPPAPGSSTISVSVNKPYYPEVVTGGTMQFNATVTGATNTAVVWSVNGLTTGNSTIGTMTAGGLYTAPAVVPEGGSVSIYATSVQDPSQTGWIVITIVVGTPFPSPLPAAPTPGLPIITPHANLSPPLLPPADVATYDYMVVAQFATCIGYNGSLAALSCGQLPVEIPAGLTSKLSQVAAPLARNQPAPAPVQVSWNASTVPQGYGVLASRAPNQSQVLNASRPAAVGGFDVFIGLLAANPDQNTPADQQGPAFSDVGSSLPLAAPPVNNRYLVAAQDIFGRWSSWVETDIQLSPAAGTKPGLVAAQFLFEANPGTPPSPIVSASLQIDFGWNWQDRAPGQIRFTGQFVPAPAVSLDPPFLGGFATGNDGPVGTPVVLTFNYTGVDPDTVSPTQVLPTIISGHTSNGPVTILGTGAVQASPDPERVQYRVELTGIQLDFSAAAELDFVLYATATEEAQPDVWSDPIDQPTSPNLTSPPAPSLYIGKIVKAFDPNPPTVTFTPPSISWTAMPDATGAARGVLEWTADPSAAGYYVWEATESALLQLLPPAVGTPDAPPATPLVTRGATLKGLIEASQDASLQGFARLTQDPIVGNRTEIVLPGAASTLYAFRISAIGNNNVESERSPQVAIFGVSRRNVPGIPRLLVRSMQGSPGGLQLIVLRVESAAPPAGYRLFRVRNYALSQNPSSMGPAKIDENSALWQDYAGATLAGNPLTGKSVVDTAAVPSWYPYYYRATAIGAQDLPNGMHWGESAYSSTQKAFVLPQGPPLISPFQVEIATFKQAALVTLITDLPATASPVGEALVELLRLEQGSPAGPLTLQTLLSVSTETIPVGSLTLPTEFGPITAYETARSIPEADGRWMLNVLLPYATAQAGSFVLRLTDPLARQSTSSF
jgi:hypothetical protein